MNKYVVAYWNDWTGELLQELVEATSAVAAVLSYTEWDDPALTTMGSIRAYAANCDCAISVLELNNRAGAGRPGPGLQTQLAQFDSESRVH